MVQPHLGPSPGREILIPAFLGLSDLPGGVKNGSAAAGIANHLTAHTVRQGFVTHLLEGGTNLRISQDLLGDERTRTTQICTHVARSVTE